MPAPSVETGTVLRLARISALVAGSLIFLYGCETSGTRTAEWIEVAVAAAFGVAALVVAWFEVALHHDDAVAPGLNEALPLDGAVDRESGVNSGGSSVRAHYSRTGDLVFSGHDTHPEYEWGWKFTPATFPAIRAAIGGSHGDVLKLVQHAAANDGNDLGAWLHAQGIPAAFRERGDTSTRETRKLPIIRADTYPRRVARSHAGIQPGHFR